MACLSVRYGLSRGPVRLAPSSGTGCPAVRWTLPRCPRRFVSRSGRAKPLPLGAYGGSSSPLAEDHACDLFRCPVIGPEELVSRSGTPGTASANEACHPGTAGRKWSVGFRPCPAVRYYRRARSGCEPAYLNPGLSRCPCGFLGIRPCLAARYDSWESRLVSLSVWIPGNPGLLRCPVRFRGMSSR